MIKFLILISDPVSGEMLADLIITEKTGIKNRKNLFRAS